MARMATKICQRPELKKDKGYAWVIVLMSFLSHFVHAGFTFGVAGNLTIVHQKFFNINLKQGSWIGSVHVGMVFLFGPVSSVLVKKFGCRVTEFLGGLCAVLGIGLSSLSRDSWHAILLYGVLAGMGLSCCYIASSAILALHFERQKYLAFSLAMLGNFLETSTWPVLSQYLLDKYGYSRAIGIMASAHIIHLIAGISFLEPQEQENVDDFEQSDDNFKRIGEDNLALDVNPNDLTSAKENDVASIPVEDSPKSTNIKDDFMELLKNPQIWMLLANAILWNTNSSGFLMLINDFIVHNTDMNVDEAAFGITILGISNIVGCLSVVATSSLKFERLTLYTSAIGFFGVAAVAASFTSSKAMYYGLVTCWGLGLGVTLACLLSVAHDFCKPRQMSLLFGLQLLASGIGSIGLVPLAAYTAEATRERYGIIFVGVCGILGAVVLLPVTVKRIRQQRNDSFNC